jgi:carbon storage regulator
MLVLSRRLNENIIIDGKIVVKVVRIERDTVRLGIQAPVELEVHRQEIYDAIQAGRASPGPDGEPAVPVAPSASAPGPPPATTMSVHVP